MSKSLTAEQRVEYVIGSIEQAVAALIAHGWSDDRIKSEIGRALDLAHEDADTAIAEPVERLIDWTGLEQIGWETFSGSTYYSRSAPRLSVRHLRRENSETTICGRKIPDQIIHPNAYRQTNVYRSQASEDACSRCIAKAPTLTVARA